MSQFEEQSVNDTGTIIVPLYEAGGEERSGFHVFNTAPNHYHRAEVLQRSGAIDITCNLEKVIHGALSPDSDRYASLLVMQWFMQPKGSRRISQATIELLFESGSADGDIEVDDISFYDTYSLMQNRQDETITKGGEATAGVQQFANLSLTGKWEKTTSTTTTDAITLSGTKRVINNTPPNRIAVWTLSENPLQPSGVPASLRVAVLVSRQDREKFLCRVNFTCQTDIKTALRASFKRIPKDDPIVFQPNPRDIGLRLNKNVEYGNDRLGSINLNDLCSVSFRRIIPDVEKPWK
ncbi:hypothetical protein V8C42DRAFT_336137 [Trichoderma barbatum]